MDNYFFNRPMGVYGRERQSYTGNGLPGLFADIYPGTENGTPSYFTEYNGKLCFYANDSVHGFELFCTDDVCAHGVQLVKDIKPGTDHSFPANLFPCNGKLYFVANVIEKFLPQFKSAAPQSEYFFVPLFLEEIRVT